MARPKHGMSGTRTYKLWSSMVRRIECPGPRESKWYAGRNITISPELRTFEGFFAALGPCPEGMSLDRIDNNRGYSPDNVRWADAKTQSRNRRSNRVLTFEGRSQSMSAWAEELGIPYERLNRRISTYRWPVEKALTYGRYEHSRPAPRRSTSRLLTHEGQTRTAAEWARHLGIPEKRLRARLAKGLPIEQVLSRKVLNRPQHKLTFNGETKCIAQWARDLGIPDERLRKRLDAGWPLEKALSATRYKSP